MKTNVIRILLIMLLLVSVTAPLVKANDVSTHLAWIDTTSQNISVDQGEKVQFYITADSFNYNANLEVGLYERDTNQLVYYFTQVDNLYDVYDRIFTIDTDNLEDNYVVRAKITGSNVDIEELYLNVVVEEPINHFNNYGYIPLGPIPDANLDLPEIVVEEEPKIIFSTRNTAPVMNPFRNKVVDEGETLNFTVSAIDEQNDPLSYEARVACPYALDLICLFWVIGGNSALPEELTFDSQSGEVAFSPGYDFVDDSEVKKTFTLKFRANDGELDSEWFNVSITVNDVNNDPEDPTDPVDPVDPVDPTPTEQFGLKVTTWENIPVDVTLVPADGKVATNFVLLQSPVNGHLEGNIPNLTYYPNLNFNGEDFFSYKVTHQDGTHNEVPFQITVLPVNDLPYAEDQYITVNEGVTVEITLEGEDVDGEVVGFEIVEDPSGNLSGDGSNLQYTSDSPGEDQFTYKVIDNEGGKSAEVTVFITVLAVEEPVVEEPTKKSDLKIMFAHYSPEVAHAGEPVLFSVNVVNDGEEDLEDLRMSIIAYDLGLKGVSRQFDLDAEDDTVENAVLHLPHNVASGNYLVKITVGNDQLHETAYREVIIN